MEHVEAIGVVLLSSDHIASANVRCLKEKKTTTGRAVRNEADTDIFRTRTGAPVIFTRPVGRRGRCLTN